jgi:hypothetical protein
MLTLRAQMKKPLWRMPLITVVMPTIDGLIVLSSYLASGHTNFCGLGIGVACGSHC